MTRLIRILSFATLALSACALDSGASDDNPADVEQASFGGALGSVLGSPVTGNNTNAATNENTPSCVPNSNAPDYNYSWTAPATGTYTFTTVGSAGTFAPFDTVLEIRNFTTNVPLGCNDDSAGTLQSTVSVPLTLGQTVRIAVDGYATNAGTFNLSISGPPGNVPGRQYRCGYAQAGFGCNNGRAGTFIQAPDMNSAIPACRLAQPSTLPDFCNVIDSSGFTASDPAGCVAQGGSWRPNSVCCNFAGSVTCPS